MKTILVPTDFSSAAFNAIEYAAEIAKLSGAKLILFHVYNIPVMPAEAPVTMPIKQIEEEALQELRHIKSRLLSAAGSENLVIEYECRLGFPAAEIRTFSEECRAGLIVMGMEGSDMLTEKLIGSITTTLIRKAACPVLAVAENVKFRSVKKIALACDYEKMDARATLAPLKELAQLFRSDIYVLNVVGEEQQVPAISKAVEGIRIDHVLEGTSHSFYAVENKDVATGINQFAEKRKIDMIAMVPHEHSFFGALFHEPDTRRMAFHSTVPLLVLHEQKQLHV